MQTAKVIQDSDRDLVRFILEKDIITNAFLLERLTPWLDRRMSSNELRTDVFVAEDSESLVYLGTNLVPLLSPKADPRAFIELVDSTKRRFASIVGDRYSVDLLWGVLAPYFEPPRVFRKSQPLMTLTQRKMVKADARVRQSEPTDLPLLFPACVAMFEEEIGISPTLNDGGISYRSRLAELIVQQRSFVRFEQGELIFKAEIGVLTPQVAQIQGVWTRPDLRGMGIGTSGIAAVIDLILLRTPTVSLYVNDFNTPALKAYQKVGFHQHSEMASILF